MTNAIWTNPVSGDWSDAGSWSVGVPTTATTAVINASGAYTITISSSDTASSLFVDAAGATLSEDSGGSLTLKRGLTLDAGTVILNAANNIGGASQLVGGTLELGNAAALGTSALTIDGGTLVGTANENFSNVLKTGGSFTMAAGDGDTVRLTSNTVIDMNSGGFIDFGQAGGDGVVVWAPVTLGLDNNGNAGFDVNVNAGTLRDGNGSLGEVLSTANTVNVAAGATLGIGGYADTFNELLGGGGIASSAGSTLTVKNGDFSGNISGGLALTVIHQLQLSGANTYTGGTTVDANAQLTLGGTGAVAGGAIIGNGAIFEIAGGVSVKGDVTIGDGATLDITGDGAIIGSLVSGNDTTLDVADNGSITGGVTIGNGSTLSLEANGSISGDITDDGTLVIEGSSSSTLTLDNPITGTGSLDISRGKVVLGAANTYSGGTTLDGGTLKIDNTDELGTGPLTLAHGNLVTTATMSFDDPVIGGGDICAVSGTILTIDTDSWALGSNAHLSFGTSAYDGTVVWDSPASAISGSIRSLSIKGGTLRVGDSDFQALLNGEGQRHGITSMANAATLDIAGFSENIYHLQGAGMIENSGASATLTIYGGAFNGDFSGPIVLNVDYNVSLSGGAANWGTINILGGSQLTLGGPSSANLVFAPQTSSYLVFNDPSQFSGSVGGVGQGDRLEFYTISGINKVSYSGDASGGVLTVSSSSQTAQINMAGDYTGGTFVLYPSYRGASPYVTLVPKPPAASADAAHTNAFDFSAAPTANVAPEAGVTHLHGGHSGSEIALAHDVTGAMHAHGFVLDHFAHSPLAHGHAELAEALL